MIWPMKKQMKGFNMKNLSLIIVFIMIIFFPACSSKNQNNASYEGISKTNLGESYKLKQFEVCEIKSSQNNVYTFLRFKNSTVANRENDTYYSKSPVLADMYVRIEESDALRNNSMQQIIDKSVSYITKIITKSDYYEKGNIAYQTIKYNFYNEIKNKIIICEKTDTGYIIHDFSYFEDGTKYEKNIIKEYMKDICTIYDISIKEF